MIGALWKIDKKKKMGRGVTVNGKEENEGGKKVGSWSKIGKTQGAWCFGCRERRNFFVKMGGWKREERGVI